MNKTLLLAGVASVFAFNAQAVELTPYVGADYNYNFTHFSADEDMGGVFPGQYHSGSLVAGAKVSPYAAAEVFGELSRHENKTVYHTDYRAYGADVLGILPLGCYGEWEVLGSAGLGRYIFKAKVKTPEFRAHESAHDWGWRLGAGVQYNITENWGVRGMYRRVIFHNSKSGFTGFDALSVGVRYAF